MLLTFDHDNIRELRLNRPPVNALTSELLVKLRQTVESAPQEGFRALVLSGTPGRFSAGLDVPFLLTLDRAGISTLWHDLYGVLKAIATSPIPIVAAITGHAPAGGAVLAAFCDWRVMADGDFKIGLNEVHVGLPMPPVILLALRRLVGARQAERLAVGGLLVSPKEALDVGLIDELSSPDKVTDAALAWCRSRLALPAEAMTVTRREARADLIALFGSGVDSELEKVAASWWHPDTQKTLRELAAKLGKKS